jgi:hypothetical protein
MSTGLHIVFFFESVSAVLVAEKVLKEMGITNKLIPVPKQLSSDCGVCLRVESDDQLRVEQALADKVKVLAIHPLS